jgi:predicted Zn-dependent protease
MTPRRRSPRLLATIAGLLALAATAAGHPGTDVAITDLTALIDAAPGSAELHLRRAACFTEHQRWTEAQADLDRAALLDPHHPGLALARAELSLARREPVAAIQTLDASLAQTPHAPAARILRARARVLAGDVGGAQADFQDALSHLSDPKPELWLEANAVITAPADALADLDRGLARLGPVPALVDRALILEVKLGRITAAAARLQALAAIAERPEFYDKRRGDLLAASGRTAEARAAYADALAAIARLPDWLRASEPTRHLTALLTTLTQSSS